MGEIEEIDWATIAASATVKGHTFRLGQGKVIRDKIADALRKCRERTIRGSLKHLDDAGCLVPDYNERLDAFKLINKGPK